MTQTVDTMIGRKVIYNGDNRPELYGLVGVVERAVANSNTWGVRYPAEMTKADQYRNTDGIVWGAVWAWDVQPDYQVEFDAHVTNMLDPHKKTVEIINAKIKLLEQQIAELRTAKKTIESL